MNKKSLRERTDDQTADTKAKMRSYNPLQLIFFGVLGTLILLVLGPWFWIYTKVKNKFRR